MKKTVVYVSTLNFLENGGVLKAGIPLYIRTKGMEFDFFGLYLEHHEDEKTNYHLMRTASTDSCPISLTTTFVAIEVDVDVKKILKVCYDVNLAIINSIAAV